MGLMTYILLGVSAVLVSFSLVILVAMVSYDNKTSKINRRIGKLAVTTNRHWESIRILSELQDRVEEKIKEQDKNMSELNDKIVILEKEIAIKHRNADKLSSEKRQLSI